jgi:hypothetical protein
MRRLVSSQSLIRLTVLLALTFAGPTFAAAQTAGYDLLQTGSGAEIDLTSLKLGKVQLQGVPIQGTTGNADTIVHRTQNMPPGGGKVDMNVNALFMQSTGHVTFSGQSADVYVTINNSGGTIPTSVLPQPDHVSPSTGSVTIRTDGTFDSSFSVNADVIFVKAGTSVTNSANYLGHQAASAITLTSTNSSWSSTAPPGYPSSGTYPSGGFYPKPVHAGPHPVVPAACPAPAPSTSTNSLTRGATENNIVKPNCIAISPTL